MSDRRTKCSRPDAPSGVWSITGDVNHATDKTLLNAAFVDSLIGKSIATIEAPRTYGVRASMCF